MNINIKHGSDSENLATETINIQDGHGSLLLNINLSAAGKDYVEIPEWYEPLQYALQAEGATATADAPLSLRSGLWETSVDIAGGAISYTLSS